jgi:hypothetical protein
MRNVNARAGLGALVLSIALAATTWSPGRAEACRGDGTAASCLREERRCMDGVFGIFRSCNFSCGDCPVRPPRWTPGPPNTAPMAEFLPAVGDTIAAIPGAVVNGFRQLGNDVVACVNDPFGSMACVRVGVVVGGTVCAIASAGTCAPLVAGAGLLMAIQNCVSSCGGQPANFDACKEACAGAAAAGGTALVGAGTGAFRPRPPLYPGGQVAIGNPLNLFPRPQPAYALAGGGSIPAAALHPPIGIAIPAVPALQPALAGGPMMMAVTRDPDGMGNPIDYRGPGPHRDRYTNPRTQGDLEAEHVPSRSVTRQQAPCVEPEPVGMGPRYSNGRKGGLTASLMRQWRAYEQMVRRSNLPRHEQDRLIREFWAIAREEDWSIHQGGGARPVDPDALDQLPAPGH